MGKGEESVVARFERGLKTNIPPAKVAIVATVATCVMMSTAWWWGLREHAEPISVSYVPSAEMIRAEQEYHSHYTLFPNSNSKMFDAVEAPLGEGHQIPSLDATGWLNGKPDDADLESKVLVIDVWDGLCPYCSLAAPAMIKANAKYRDQGVVFIGLTTAREEEARLYVDCWQLPWANGYDATTTIDALKAHAPTVFVVAPDGHILWNDDRARWHHDHVNLGQRLEIAIEDALGVNRKG
jgi:thiol-disulfide isomerase/thioredoxin